MRKETPVKDKRKAERTPSHAVTARAAACRSLVRLEKEGRYSNIELDATLQRTAFSPADRGLYTRLVYGVTERKITLDYIIEHLAGRPAAALDLPLRTVLRMGLCQLLYFDRIPDTAAVDESVELAKQFCPAASGLVNAVLRRFCREGKVWKKPSMEDPDRYLSILYSVPVWLCAKFRADYGFDRAESILAAFLHTPPITLRVNTLRMTRDALLNQLREAGYDAEATRYSPYGIKLSTAAVGELAPLKDGSCFVQDEASQICVMALGAQPGEEIIDTCACPGGKSFGIAMEMENRGRLRSFDLHENKLSLLRRGAEGLGISIIEAAARDGRREDPALLESADRILCDLPCSGLGVLWKKPELRYREPDGLERLPALQLEILHSSAACLKPGGTMIFSTCTISKDENEAVLAAFLASHPDFSPVPFHVGRLDAPAGLLTLFPDEHGTDGFFIAKLQRNPT